MIRITGSSSNVFEPVDIGDLTQNFRLAIKKILPGEDTGQITHQIDGRYFSIPLEGTPWTVDSKGVLSLNIGKVPEKESVYAHSIVPLSWGVWRVGVNPAEINYLDSNGQPQKLVAEHKPLIFVMGWFPLFLLFLPGLVWTLYYFRPRKYQPTETEINLPELYPPSQPSPLPALPPSTTTTSPPIPTLYVGLGGVGLRALHAVRGDLKQSNDFDNPPV